MYTWLRDTGERVKTKTVKDFALKYGFRESNARSLACGHRMSLNGWVSTHPRAKKRRERIFTVLLHPATGKKVRVGTAVTRFAEEHGLAVNDTYQLLNARLICYRGWMLERTYRLAHGAIPGVNF